MWNYFLEHGYLHSFLALRSNSPVANLNVREQWDICGHMSIDIPIVPDRVGAGCPPVAGSIGLFSLPQAEKIA